MRIVISTKTLVSHLFWKDSVPNQAVDLAFEHGEVVYSDRSLRVLEKVLLRGELDQYLAKDKREEFIRLFTMVATRIDIVDPVKVCKNPQDNVVLELAFNSGAAYVISGEKSLLEQDYFGRMIHVITPGAFVQIMSPCMPEEGESDGGLL